MPNSVRLNNSSSSTSTSGGGGTATSAVLRRSLSLRTVDSLFNRMRRKSVKVQETASITKERREMGPGVREALERRREQRETEKQTTDEPGSSRHADGGRLARMRRSLSARLLRSEPAVAKRFTSFAARDKPIRGDARHHQHPQIDGMVRLARPTRLGMDCDRNAISEDELTTTVRLRKTISSDALLNSDSPLYATNDLRSPGSISSNSSHEKRNGDDPPRTLVKKKKYFSERNNKNIFKKLLHPSYQERNTQYRRLFGHLVDDNDLFLISFSCAYQREILCQGRMYISQKHVCFHANILGWETCFALPFDDIESITKERAALIFPNSIQLETKSGEKYFFASFVNRDKTVGALNMVVQARADGEPVLPEEMWETMNVDKDGKYANKRLSNRSLTSPLSTMESSPPMTPFPTRTEFPAIEEVASHLSVEEQEEVQCPCDNHFGKLLLDCVFPISVKELRSLLFSDSPWFDQFNHALKNTGYSASAWALDRDGQESRTCTYTMALNHAMAPKSCVVTEKQVISSFGRHGDGFIVQKETQNSGVPYADHFTVQCSYCISRASATESRLRVHGGINYKKSIWSMVKGYIEKSTYQGLDDHYSALESTLNEECDRRETERNQDRFDNESLGSSVEDPTTTTITETFVETALPKVSAIQAQHTPRRIEPVRSFSIEPTPIDYGPYIRVIIALLGGLLLLNLLLLFRVGSMEQQDTRAELTMLLKKFNPVGERASSENAVLESLLSTVNQLTMELKRLKETMNHRDEL